MNNHTKIKENLFLIEPIRYIQVLRKNVWLILFGMIIFTAMGVVIATTKESKSWSAIAKVIRYDKKISIPSDVPYQFQDFNYETALETIRTRANLVELIQDLNLTTTPEALFSKFEIKRGRNSDIIEVIFTDSDKKLAAQAANQLSHIFIKNFFIIQNAAIEKISHYYEKSKQIKIKDLEKAKKDISFFLSKNKLISLEHELQMKYDQLNIIQLQKLQNKTHIQALKTTIQETSISLKKLPDDVKLRYAVRSAKKKFLEQKRKELQTLKKKYTVSHPKIKSLVGEITQIQKSIQKQKNVVPDEVTYGTNPLKSEMNIDLSKAKIAYASAKNTDISLETQIQKLKNKIANLSSLKKHFDQLSMHKEEAKDQLKIISNRLYDLKMTIGSSKEDFKLFEKAQIPKYPKPSYKKIIVIMFSILGLTLSIVIILIREFLNDSIKTKFDLAQRFGIGEVTQLARDKVLSDKIKHSFSYLANSLITSNCIGTKIISVGSDIPKAVNPNVISLLLEQLNQQNKKTLHIEITSIMDNEEHAKCMSIEKILINVSHINDNIDKAYWCIKEDYSIYTPNVQQINSLILELTKLRYDYIIIQVPPYSEAEHFVPVLLDLSDNFILTTKFGVSSRKVIYQFMKQIKDEDISKIKGVINETHRHFI
ncbi:MAG: succinoglycan biosynthesis transport protein ExoP [Sulfurimonas sp.]|jgi:succinoglycan biosynthesis transport protein ExoP|uniref:GumC family protein n=1 Tax=Sulfurimonas sp. TaxID=2022749 RepID=UPI0039E44BE7